jgi:hypothetical protein
MFTKELKLQIFNEGKEFNRMDRILRIIAKS